MKIINISVNDTNYSHAESMAWSSGKWNDLHKVTEKYEYSAIYFVDEKRHKASAKGASTIILDFDDGMSLKEAYMLFAEYRALIVTTKSHQKDKHGLTCDRFRVIFPLVYSIIDMNYYEELMREIISFYKSDRACSDSARYYSPNNDQIVHYTKGHQMFDAIAFADKSSQSRDVPSEGKANKTYVVKSNETQNGIKRIGLKTLMTTKVYYYTNKGKQSAELSVLCNTLSVSEKTISCHCFLNEEHEDNNPSCFIRRYEKGLYAKCMSCLTDGFIKI